MVSYFNPMMSEACAAPSVEIGAFDIDFDGTWRSRDPLNNITHIIADQAPVFGAMIDQVIKNVAAPEGIVVGVGIAAIATGTQHLADVRTPSGKTCPISALVIVEGESGSRKSGAFEAYFSVFEDEDQLAEEEYEAALRQHKIDRAEHRRKQSILNREINAAGELTPVLKQKLGVLATAEPVAPSKTRTTIEDCSVVQYLEILSSNQSCVLASTEGSIIFSGKLFKSLGFLCKVWSGEPVFYDRNNKPSLRLAGVRCTGCILAQPRQIDFLCSKKGEHARDTGLVARAIFRKGNVMMGCRLIHSLPPADEAYVEYRERMRGLLKESSDAKKEPNFEREVIQFSPEATELWRIIANRIEIQMRPGCIYERARDHASKLAENIARVAAAMHKFEGIQGPISPGMLRVAAMICEDSSRDFLQRFVKPPEDIQDAIDLHVYLLRKINPPAGIRKNYVRQYGPGGVRKDPRFSAALDRLVEQGVIQTAVNVRDRSEYLFPGPAFLPGPRRDGGAGVP